MKSYVPKFPAAVYAEQVVFTDEEKDQVLKKQRVMKYGGEVKVTRPGQGGEDSFFVGLSVGYSFVLVPEGDYLVTDKATGKQSVCAKEAFERDYVSEELETITLDQEDIDANPELADLEPGTEVQIPAAPPVVEADGPAEPPAAPAADAENAPAEPVKEKSPGKKK